VLTGVVAGKPTAVSITSGTEFNTEGTSGTESGTNNDTEHGNNIDNGDNEVTSRSVSGTEN